MWQSNVYNLCCQYHGKRVRINDNRGNVHVGTITRVTRKMVWIQPDNRFNGLGLGFRGFGVGFGVGIAIGAITGIVLASAFFW